jgi:hypothetical protein
MSDKRSVATDALETLGTAPIPDNSGRDAIHLAVEPVVAATMLLPGQKVGILPDGRAGSSAAKLVGIVDPFVPGPVEAGARFWLVLLPRTISALRHVWSHPDFPEDAAPPPSSAPSVEESRRWIDNFARSIPLDVAVLMGGASEYLSDGEYLVFGGLLEGETVPDEFWDHYERVTGETVPDEDRGSFFSCSC